MAVDLHKMKGLSQRAYLRREKPMITNEDFDAMINEIVELREEVVCLTEELENCTEFESPMLDYGEIPPLDERIKRAKERKKNGT